MYKLKVWLQWILPETKRYNRRLGRELESGVVCLTAERCEQGPLDVRQGQHKVFFNILIESATLNPDMSDATTLRIDTALRRSIGGMGSRFGSRI